MEILIDVSKNKVGSMNLKTYISENLISDFTVDKMIMELSK